MEHSAIAQHHLSIEDIVSHVAVLYRVRPAGIGVVHASKGRIFAAGGIRWKEEALSFESMFEFPQAKTRFTLKRLFLFVEMDEPVHVLRKINDDTLAQR